MIICCSMPSIQVVWGLLRLLDDADPLCLGFVCFFLHKNHFLRWFQDRGRLSRPAFFPVCSQYPWGMLHVQGSWGMSSTAFLDLWFWCYVSFLRPQFLLVVVLLQEDFSLQITWMRIPVGLGLVNNHRRLSVMDCDSISPGNVQVFNAYTVVGARGSCNDDVCVCMCVGYIWVNEIGVDYVVAGGFNVLLHMHLGQ